MKLETLLRYVGKLIVSGLAFFVGTMVGGIVANLLNLSVPTPPQGADMGAIQIYMLLTTPLLALALALLATRIAGTWLTRGLALAFLMWIAYSVNTQLEASIVSTYAASMWFAIVSNLFAALFCGLTVAWLFAPEVSDVSAGDVVKNFLQRRSTLAHAWRLPTAAVVFMPIYFVFGLMVLPFTGEYYRQQMFGLVAPTIEQLLPILFVRSVLFLLACLPITMLWFKSDRELWWRLGVALFLLVGFVIMLYATWLPLYVRLPHTVEILADELVYAGALVFLLGKGHAIVRLARRPRGAMLRR